MNKNQTAHNMKNNQNQKNISVPNNKKKPNLLQEAYGLNQK